MAVALVAVVMLLPGPSAPASGPVWSGIAIGTANEAARGTSYWYNFTIESAGSGVTWNSVQLQVSDPTGVVTAGIVSYTVLNSTSVVVLSSPGPTETAWTGGVAGAASSVVASTETISLRTSVNLASTGAELTAVSVGAFSGTSHANIP